MLCEFFPELTEERWWEISDAFRKCSHFPNCLGAIDGKHVRVTKFPCTGSMNLNYVLFFYCSHGNCRFRYKFTYADSGAYRKECDSSVFQETSFFKLLIWNKLHIPPPGPLFTNDNENFPFVFVSGEAFSLLENLMRPYAGHNLSEKQRIFNYRLCWARR